MWDIEGRGEGGGGGGGHSQSAQRDMLCNVYVEGTGSSRSISGGFLKRLHCMYIYRWEGYLAPSVK